MSVAEEQESGITGELSSLLNRYSAESVSGTPDFILAELLIGVLQQYNEAVSRRAEWRGELVDFTPGRHVTPEPVHALPGPTPIYQPYGAPQEYIYDYPAEILRWVDGDTVEMRAWKTMDFGFKQKVTPEHTGRFRLTIVDTPERGDPGYKEAIEFVNDVLPPGTKVQIRTYRDPDVFGRYLADIKVPGEGTTSISSKLLQHGLATLWD